MHEKKRDTIRNNTHFHMVQEMYGLSGIPLFTKGIKVSYFDTYGIISFAFLYTN